MGRPRVVGVVREGIDVTRRPFRDLEDDLKDLEAATDDDGADEGPMVGHRDPRTGEVTTMDGEPIPPDDRDGLLAVIEHSVVMERSALRSTG